MKNKVIELIKNNLALDEEVDIDTPIKSLSLDSLSFINLIIQIEETYDIDFSFDELDIKKWNNVNDFIQTIKEKLNEKQ